MAANPVVLSMNEQEISSSEETLIDKYFDIFNIEITVSPVSMSRLNLLDNVGTHIPSLEVTLASIIPYVVEMVFPFPKIVSWCAE